MLFFGYNCKISDYIYMIMGTNILGDLMTYWEKSWYTGMILFLSTCVALITGIITFKPEKTRILFLLFIFSCIISGNEAKAIFLTQASENERTLFWIYGMVFSSIFEFIAYYYFFFKILKGLLIKLLMKTFSIALGLLVTIFFFFAIINNSSLNTLVKLVGYLISIDIFFIIVPPLFYYWEILKMPVIPDLFKSNAFLISTCIFFPYVLVLPILNISEYLKEKFHPFYQLFFSAHYILLCFLFIVLTRAFLWKKPLTT